MTEISEEHGLAEMATTLDESAREIDHLRLRLLARIRQLEIRAHRDQAAPGDVDITQELAYIQCRLGERQAQMETFAAWCRKRAYEDEE